ncbi:MAG: DNA repair protein RadC [Tannerellaceae bacterium]|jgi:DNA repair protein RadC|nr:DNA repair protein RadC [Tannerellaceae bacterium]
MNNISIKNLPVDDRPREKMLLKGASSLSNAELLAILIGSGTKHETAVQLSQRILKTADNNLNELGKVTIKSLIGNFKGIGEAKAITIAAALELGRRRTATERSELHTIRCSKDAHSLFYALLCDLGHEEVWIALTNASAKVIEKVKICQGGISDALVDVRLIMRAAIQASATGIILCHNHPSGSATPSRQDDALTIRVEKAAEIMSMRLLDHIIISDLNYYSYADEGRLSGSQH